VADRVRIIEGDALQVDLSEATVVTLYLLTFLNDRLKPRLLALRPGTRIVAHNYGITGWEADELLYYNETRALLWYVPAQVAGAWRVRTSSPVWSVPLTLTLSQTEQRVSGEAFFGNEGRGIRDAGVRGDRVRMVFVDPATGLLWTLNARVVSGRRESTLQGYLSEGRAVVRFAATRT